MSVPAPSNDFEHRPVMLTEITQLFADVPAGTVVDATLGGGGHAASILEAHPHLDVLGIDQDTDALSAAIECLKGQRKRLRSSHRRFNEFDDALADHQITEISGALFDLGVSSPQLDRGDRGFSYRNDGPLDMRMNPEEGQSAEQWINSAAETEIADVLYQYGEERHSRRMARRVILERAEKRITRTGELAEIIKEANPAWERDKHPATRAFQGIRIFINDEMGELERGLEQALKMLKVGGRLVVISFHSLEDRMVKRFIAKQAKGDSFPRGLPISQDMLSPKMNPIGKRIKASALEVDRNTRSRSAVMRVAEKIAH